MTPKIDISIEVVMNLARQLPIELKKQLVNEWTQVSDIEKREEQYLPDLDLEGWNQPIKLEEYALKKEALPALIELWEDELPAEDLIEMLTK